MLCGEIWLLTVPLGESESLWEGYDILKKTSLEHLGTQVKQKRNKVSFVPMSGISFWHPYITLFLSVSICLFMAMSGIGPMTVT